MLRIESQGAVEHEILKGPPLRRGHLARSAFTQLALGAEYRGALKHALSSGDHLSHAQRESLELSQATAHVSIDHDLRIALRKRYEIGAVHHASSRSL